VKIKFPQNAAVKKHVAICAVKKIFAMLDRNALLGERGHE
jgi:hypothetical protein